MEDGWFELKVILCLLVDNPSTENCPLNPRKVNGKLTQSTGIKFARNQAQSLFCLTLSKHTNQTLHLNPLCVITLFR